MIAAHGHRVTYAPRVTHGYRAVWCVETVTPPAWFACLGRALAWCAQWPREATDATQQDMFETAA